MACCFDLAMVPTDYCDASCPSSHLQLYCANDGNCASPQHCCTVYDLFGLTGSECRDDCNGIDAASACDPVDSSCTCGSLLDGYFMGGTASPPYDQYGICN